MKNAIIVHGTGGNPDENWFQWLKWELETLWISTIVPDFWDDEFPDIEKWKKIFSEYEKDITWETLLIGHSLWGAFLLKFLQSFQHKVYLLATVWSPVWVKPIRFYEGDNTFLNGFDFDWDQIKNKMQHKIVFHSDDDPYVSLWNGKELAQNIDTELIFIPSAGHFNTDSWYTQFPRLLTEIKRYL